jgi:hypothetical protein
VLASGECAKIRMGRQGFCVLLFAWALALSASASSGIRLTPKYVPGQTFRYRLESRTAASGTITTPILNPEGATVSHVSIHLEIRLDVLDRPSGGNPATARLRATYEKSSADSQSDAFDPAHPSPSVEYAKLEGRSFELAVDSSGHTDTIQGVEDGFPDRATRQAALSWLGEVFWSGTFPGSGVTIGRKWKSERAVEGAPFSDLIWRAESSYLRDEPCHAESEVAVAPNRAAPPQEGCAVILTRSTILRRGSVHSEATAPDYLRNGLRVSGSWTGSGQSLDWVSLSTGWLVRSTQTSDQQMDYQITSAATGSKIRNRSHVQSQSEITLLSARSAGNERN